MEGDFNLIFAILILLLLLFGSIVALLIYSGLFTPVDIRAGKPPFQSIVICYKFERGPYKNAGSLFTEVTCLICSAKIKNPLDRPKCIGLYYDDPSDVAPNDLRYAVGAILSSGDPVTPEQERCRDILIDNGYKLAKLPAVSHAVTTTFPFKNTLSIFLAVAKVYPQMATYIKERNLCAHPMIEVYEHDIIHFVAPLAKQDEFYVPEATDDHSDDDNSIKHKEGFNVPSRSSTKRRLSGHMIGDQDKNSGDTKLETPEDVAAQNEGSNGSGEESAGSSFEELAVEGEK